MSLLAFSVMMVLGAQPVEDFPDVDSITVLPSKTDPAIRQFDTDHTVYWPTKGAIRDQLVIFLPGTFGKGTGAVAYCRAIASFGYRVLNLSYPTGVAAAKVRNRQDRDAFKNFRLEIIEGGDRSDAVEVSRTDSIENRLLKAIAWLTEERPTENWPRYLDGKELNWERLIFCGHSQGAGHAGLIGTLHRVARVVMTGGPKDFDRATNSPAGWYGSPATPAGRFFCFNHVKDTQGCDFAETLQNCRQMGMDQFGGAVDVESVPPPFRGSRILSTDVALPNINSERAHGSVISDRIAPRAKDGTLRFLPVWKYLFTTPVK